MSSLRAQLRGQRLTTAEIVYHLPDYPDILQTYVWQNLDTAPRFPILRRFCVSGIPIWKARCTMCASPPHRWSNRPSSALSMASCACTD